MLSTMLSSHEGLGQSESHRTSDDRGSHGSNSLAKSTGERPEVLDGLEVSGYSGFETSKEVAEVVTALGPDKNPIEGDF